MNSRATALINELNLQPHPEGGFFRELHRSAEQVNFHDKKRDAITTIYFLLPEKQYSRWHLVDADEVWHYYEGAPLDLYMASPDASSITHIRLGAVDLASGTQPVFTIPAGYWQCAASSGDYTLTGCSVGPGFDFSGFRFLNETETTLFAAKFPTMNQFL